MWYNYHCIQIIAKDNLVIRKAILAIWRHWLNAICAIAESIAQVLVLNYL